MGSSRKIPKRAVSSTIIGYSEIAAYCLVKLATATGITIIQKLLKTGDLSAISTGVFIVVDDAMQLTAYWIAKRDLDW
jgi:hypothetical protein